MEDSQCCVSMYAHGQFCVFYLCALFFPSLKSSSTPFTNQVLLAGGEIEMCLWVDRFINNYNTLHVSYWRGESYHVTPLLSTLQFLLHRFGIKSKIFTMATSLCDLAPVCPSDLISCPFYTVTQLSPSGLPTVSQTCLSPCLCPKVYLSP